MAKGSVQKSCRHATLYAKSSQKVKVKRQKLSQGDNTSRWAARHLAGKRVSEEKLSSRNVMQRDVQRREKSKSKKLKGKSERQ